ncbi:MAG TPA: hypothetical protein VHD36_01775 [Pirellulales bacterium]|nr:hypothetical protein [Pirellulales bacterium]
MGSKDLKRNSPTRRLGFGEQLEDRHLLSGHGLAFTPALQQFESHLAPSAAAQLAAHAITSAISHLTSSSTSHTVLTTQLTDSSGTATGTATYSTGTYDGTTETRFTVSISGATANTTYDVAVGGTDVGTITTDANGAGKLVLSSNPDSNEQSLPANFPTTVTSGTAVTVGTLSGSLATPTNSGGGCGGGEHGGLTDVTRLTATLTDPSSSATGTVSYKSGTTEDGTTVTRFKVTVTGATASTTLDVAVGGTVVGQITTDASGGGSLTLSSHPKNSNEQSLPSNFPTSITSGTAVTVGTLSGTLGTPSESSGTSSFRSFFARGR